MKTPNNSIVPDTHTFSGTDISYTSDQLAALENELDSLYNGAILLESPSNKYNCHGYAWHVSEGGNKVWIGRVTAIVTAEDIYWQDGSYVEVSENSATKVSYHQNGNHSAVKAVGNSGWYRSKWGNGPLVSHRPNDVPYGFAASLPKKYYIRNTSLSITGPATLCSGSGSFTVSNPPAGYSWNKSSNLTLVSTSGNTATFNMSINTNTKSGWVSIVAGGTEVARKYVGAPVVTGITGSTSVPNGQYAAYHANVPSESSPANYQWILNPQGNNNLYGASTASLDIAFYTAGNYQLVCRAYNSCGWGDYKVINLNVYNTGSYSIAYPNPAANYLTVSFNPERVAQTQASLQSAATGAQAARRTFLLSVKLYDQAGVVRRQTTSTGQDASLDVSSLPNGFYILHVHDGIADKPEVHRILVSH